MRNLDDIVGLDSFDDLPEKLKHAFEHASAAAGARAISDRSEILGYMPNGNEMEPVVRGALIEKHLEVAYKHYQLALRRTSSEDLAMAVFCAIIGMYAGRLVNCYVGKKLIERMVKDEGSEED